MAPPWRPALLISFRRPFVMLLAAFLCIGLAKGISNALTVYYATYILEAPEVVARARLGAASVDGPAFSPTPSAVPARPSRRGGPADAAALDAAALLTTRVCPVSGEVADKTNLPRLRAQ